MYGQMSVSSFTVVMKRQASRAETPSGNWMRVLRPSRWSSGPSVRIIRAIEVRMAARVPDLEAEAEAETEKPIVRRLPLPAVGYVIHAVATALEVAHGVPVIHRDVTPKNILVSNTGAVQLTDFGTAHGMREVRVSGVHDEATAVRLLLGIRAPKLSRSGVTASRTGPRAGLALARPWCRRRG